jgi:hypothetical protein
LGGSDEKRKKEERFSRVWEEGSALAVNQTTGTTLDETPVGHRRLPARAEDT